MFHPLDPFPSLVWPELWAAGSGSSPAATGYASAFGFGSFGVAHTKGGTAHLEGQEPGLFLAHGEKNGAAEARGIQASAAIGNGSKGGAAEALSLSAAYLLAHGFKLVIAGEGFALGSAYPRIIALGQKVGAGHGYSAAFPGLLTHGQHNAQVSAVLRQAAQLFVFGMKAGEMPDSLGILKDYGYTLSAGFKAGTSGRRTHAAPWLTAYSRSFEGFGLVYGFPSLLGRGEKSGAGYARVDAEAFLELLSLKSGTAFGYNFDEQWLIASGASGPTGFMFGPSATFARSSKHGAGGALAASHPRLHAARPVIIVFPPRIVDEFPRVWILDE